MGSAAMAERSTTGTGKNGVLCGSTVAILAQAKVPVAAVPSLPLMSKGPAVLGMGQLNLCLGIVESVLRCEGPTARVFATALGASLGGAGRHQAAAMLSAAWREHAASPSPVQAEAGSEDGQRLAVIEAAMITQRALAEEGLGTIQPLAMAINGLRQLNRAANEAKHYKEPRNKVSRELQCQPSDPESAVPRPNSSTEPEETCAASSEVELGDEWMEKDFPDHIDCGAPPRVPSEAPTSDGSLDFDYCKERGKEVGVTASGGPTEHEHCGTANGPVQGTSTMEEQTHDSSDFKQEVEAGRRRKGRGQKKRTSKEDPLSMDQHEVLLRSELNRHRATLSTIQDSGGCPDPGSVAYWQNIKRQLMARVDEIQQQLDQATAPA